YAGHVATGARRIDADGTHPHPPRAGPPPQGSAATDEQGAARTPAILDDLAARIAAGWPQ
ncbi:MAG: hypothetical protein ABF893_17365, partial [Gluconacetobacter liquefaciens]